MALGHLGQFNEIHCVSRPHEFLSNYIFMLGYLFGMHWDWSFQAHILKSIPAHIPRSWNILDILGSFAFSVFLFLPFWRHTLKNERLKKTRSSSWNTRRWWRSKSTTGQPTREVDTQSIEVSLVTFLFQAFPETPMFQGVSESWTRTSITLGHYQLTQQQWRNYAFAQKYPHL